MSTASQEIYNNQLAYILGEDGHFTDSAVYDPAGSALSLTGIFDSVTYKNAGKDSSGNSVKNATCIFIVTEAPAFDIYTQKQLTVLDNTYTIDYIDYDSKGAQVLWLV